MGDGGEGGNGGRDVAQEEVVGEVEHDEGGRGHRWWRDPGGEAFPEELKVVSAARINNSAYAVELPRF